MAQTNKPSVKLKGLSGGRKQQYIREHREEILTYYRRYGVESTMTKYCLSGPTMFKLLRENRQPALSTSGDRALDLAQLANARSQEAQRAVRELQTQYSQFVSTVSEDIRTKFLQPLIQLAIRIPPELEAKEDNTLRLDDVDELRKLK